MNAIPTEAQELVEKIYVTASVPAMLTIANGQQYEQAGEQLKELSAAEKRIEDMRQKLKAPILAAGKAIDAFFKTPLDRIANARSAYKKAILHYQIEQEQIRRQAEARAQEEARKEREKLEAQAAKAAAKGKEEKAAALAAAASAVTVPVIPTTTPKVSGISVRTTYKAVVVDKLALVKAVAAGAVPLNALDANMPFLNNQARAMKETMAYPGVEVEQETGLASRSA